MGKPVPPECWLVPRMLGRTVGDPLPLIIEPLPRMRERYGVMRAPFDEVELVSLRLGSGVGRSVSLEKEPNRDTVPSASVGAFGENEEDEAPEGPKILPESEVRPAAPVGVGWITPLPGGSPVKSGRE